MFEASLLKAGTSFKALLLLLLKFIIYDVAGVLDSLLVI